MGGQYGLRARGRRTARRPNFGPGIEFDAAREPGRGGARAHAAVSSS